MDHIATGRKLSVFAAAALGLGGILVILGWQFRVGILKGASFGTFVAPNTALLFVISAIAVILQLTSRPKLERIGSYLGLLICLASLVTIAEYITGRDFGIDRLFMSHRLSDWYLKVPVGRFTIPTALNFFLGGIGIFALRRKLRYPVAEVAAGLLAMSAYYGILGYLYNARALIGHVTAFPTILLFVFFSAAIFCGCETLFFLRLITSSYAGGFVARRVMVSILVLLPVFGWIEIKGREMESLSREVGIALLVAVSVLVFTVVALHTASALNEVDRKRRQAESVLVRTEKLAAAGRMAATIAHEINNPLNAVTNLLFLGRSLDASPEERDQYLIKAEQELARVAAIAKQTLGFYRESSAPASLSPSALVSEVLEIYRSRSDNKRVTVEKLLSCPMSVFGNPGEIRQALSNLIANAIDAAPAENGRVRVTVTCENGSVHIDVTDNGAGVPKYDRERLFEAFFTTKKDFGTGLGLWVSKQLIEKNSGEIFLLHSRPEADQTTFRIALMGHSTDAAATQG